MVRKPGPWDDPRFPRFAPAQNAGGAPVTTTAPTPSSASRASKASTISSTIGAVRVFRSSGLLRVTVATRSATSTSTRLMAGVLHCAAAGPGPYDRSDRERPATPIPAATVIVLRDGGAGLEALLLRREERGTFGGMWVFPGGRVDPADADDLAPDAEQAAARQAAVARGLRGSRPQPRCPATGAVRPLVAATDRAEAVLDVVLRDPGTGRRRRRRRRRGPRPLVAATGPPRWPATPSKHSRWPHRPG